MQFHWSQKTKWHLPVLFVSIFLNTNHNFFSCSWVYLTNSSKLSKLSFDWSPSLIIAWNKKYIFSNTWLAKNQIILSLDFLYIFPCSRRGVFHQYTYPCPLLPFISTVMIIILHNPHHISRSFFSLKENWEEWTKPMKSVF